MYQDGTENGLIAKPDSLATSLPSVGESFPINVFLMGSPSIRVTASGHTFPGKGYQLLTYLALSPGYRASRRRIAELLWDTNDGAAAFGNLRQLLVRIKRAVNADMGLIDADSGDIWLIGCAPSIDLQAIITDDNQMLLKYCRGQLLDGVKDLSDSFHDWLTVERSRLEDRYFSAVERRLREITWHGRARKEELDRIAASLLRIDPEREGSYRALISAYGRANYLEEAERLQREMSSRVDRGLDLSMSSETLAVTRRLAQSRTFIQEIKEAGQICLESRDKTPPRVSFLKPRWLEEGASSAPLLDALVEDVANELSRFRTFTMLAPHSTFQCKDAIGAGFSEGAIQSDFQISGFVKPDQFLSLRLVKVPSGEIVWAGEFPVARDSLLKSFSNLCRLITQDLSAGIERELARDFGKRTNAGAYGNYLLGQSAMRECVLPRLREARKHFQKSKAEAPHFAPAYARVAQTLYQEWLLVGAGDPEKLNEAHFVARRSVDVDPNDGLSHWINGVIALYRREFDLSEEHFEIAEVIAPNSADLLVQYGDALSHLGRPSLGMDKFERALEINPMPPEHYWWVGASIAFNLEKFDKSIEYCMRIKDDESVVRILAAAHALNGDLRVARYYGHKIKELYPNVQLEDLVRAAPDKDQSRLERFKEGLKISGI